MKLIAWAVLALIAPSAALACSTIAAADDRLACYDAQFSSVNMIRCRGVGGQALCEVTAPSPDANVSCVAFDANNEPLGRGWGRAGSAILISDLEAEKIERLDCQLTQ